MIITEKDVYIVNPVFRHKTHSYQHNLFRTALRSFIDVVIHNIAVIIIQRFSEPVRRFGRNDGFFQYINVNLRIHHKLLIIYIGRQTVQQFHILVIAFFLFLVPYQYIVDIFKGKYQSVLVFINKKKSVVVCFNERYRILCRFRQLCCRFERGFVFFRKWKSHRHQTLLFYLNMVFCPHL